MSHVMNKC